MAILSGLYRNIFVFSIFLLLLLGSLVGELWHLEVLTTLAPDAIEDLVLRCHQVSTDALDRLRSLFARLGSLLLCLIFFKCSYVAPSF